MSMSLTTAFLHEHTTAVPLHGGYSDHLAIVEKDNTTRRTTSFCNSTVRQPRGNRFSLGQFRNSHRHRSTDNAGYVLSCARRTTIVDPGAWNTKKRRPIRGRQFDRRAANITLTALKISKTFISRRAHFS